MLSAIVRSLVRYGKRAWSRLPCRLRESRAVVRLGTAIHVLSRKFSDRRQSESTWFLRNRPLLMAIRDSVEELRMGTTIQLCDVGCCSGPEMYSLLWTIRKARPDLNVLPIGVDISERAIAKARTGLFSAGDPELRTLSQDVLAELFDTTTIGLKIKQWIAEGVKWIVGDARDPDLVSRLGRQDILLANNFLVHMREQEATACVRNLIQLVRPGGLFVCRGIDLNVRDRVSRELKLQPLFTRLEEIHNAEPSLDAPSGWPWSYWGLEPMDKSHRDWARRYTAIFRV